MARLSFLVLLSLSSSLSAAGQGEDAPLQQLATQLKATELRADHIVLLDLSGSMLWAQVPGSRRRAAPGSRRFDAVLSALPSLLDAIPEGDFVDVIGFNEGIVEDPAFLVSNWKGTSSRDALVNALRTRLAPGRDTDLCLALQAAQKQIQRDGHHELQFVCFLTDGEHDAPSSPLCRTADSPGWRLLKQDWDGLEHSGAHDLAVYLFGLYDVAQPGLLRGVLPKLLFLHFQSTEDLRRYFTSRKLHKRPCAPRGRGAKGSGAEGRWMVSSSARG